MVYHKNSGGAYSVSCWVRGGYRHGRFPYCAGASRWRNAPGELALIALTVGMVPSIPNGRGASPKRTWRQTQAGAAPNSNPCQLPPIAAHCRFEPFQGLGHPSQEASGIRPLPPPVHFTKTHTVAVLFKTIFSSPVRLVARRASFLARAVVFCPVRACRQHSDFGK
jgi:hypothetical protein